MSKSITFNVKVLVDGKEQVVSMTSNIKELQKGLSAIGRNSDKLAHNFINLNQKVQAAAQAFNGLSEAGRILGDLTKESRGFATAMAEANTMAGKDAAGLKQMKEQVTALSKEVPVARDALAKGLYQVISNGVPEDNILSFLEASARSSVGGIADLQKVVTVTSTVIKNYGAAWTDAAAIQDKIQLTAKNGVTSFEQLADALPRVSGNASTLGVSIDELLASFATLTGVSGNTAEVSTQLAAIFTALVKPSSEAAKMAEAMGIQFDAMAIKSAGGMQNFLVSLDQSVKAYAASSGVLEQEVYAKLFGSAEALRALIPLNGELSDKFGQNVAAMKDSAGTMNEAFDQMAKTGEAKSQALANSYSWLTDAVSKYSESIRSVLTYASSIGNVMAGVYSLTQALRALHVTQRASAIATTVWTTATKAAHAVSITVSAMLTMLRAKFHGVAIGATTAKVAVRGFLASTGVGVLVIALGLALEKLIAYFDDTADAADGTDEAMRRSAKGMDAAKQAAERVKGVLDRTESDTLTRLQSSYKRLQAEWKALTTEHQRREWISKNQSAFGELDLSITSVLDAENAFVRNTATVVGAFKRRAQEAAIAAALTENYREQLRIKGLIDQSDARTDAGMKVRAGDVVDGKKFALNARDGRMAVGTDGKWRWTEEGAKQQNARTYKSNGTWTNNMRDALNALTEQEKALTGQLTELAKAGGSVPGKKGTEGGTTVTGTRTSSAQSDTLPAPQLIVPAAFTQDVTNALKQGLQLPALKQGPSVAESAGAFDAYRRQRYDQAQARVQAVQHDLAIGIIGKDKAMEDIDEINAALADLGMKPIEVEVEASGFSKGLDQIREGWGSIQGVVSGFEQLRASIEGNGTVWEKFTGVINATLSILSSIEPILSIVNMLTAVGTARKQADTAATAAHTAVTVADTAATTAQTAANAGEAITAATKEGAKMPFPANIAAIAAGVAAVVGAIAMVAGAFAEGGIVPGTSRTGDRLLARVNSGEMILNASQQARLFRIANGAAVTPPRALMGHDAMEVSLPLDRLRSTLTSLDGAGGSVEFKIKGRELVGVLSREGNYRQRT